MSRNASCHLRRTRISTKYVAAVCKDIWPSNTRAKVHFVCFFLIALDYILFLLKNIYIEDDKKESEKPTIARRQKRDAKKNRFITYVKLLQAGVYPFRVPTHEPFDFRENLIAAPDYYPVAAAPVVAPFNAGYDYY